MAFAGPDVYHGSEAGALYKPISLCLYSQVQPSTDGSRPTVPSFFIKAEGPAGNTIIAGYRVAYDGAFRARAIHKLRHYRQAEEFDINAYCLSAVVKDGWVIINAHHLTKSSRKDQDYDLHITQVSCFLLRASPGSTTGRRGTSLKSGVTIQ